MNSIENFLEPFVGYLNLEMWTEANEELESLPTELKTHPAVLLARLELLVETEHWEEGSILGESLCGLWPDRPQFFLQTAYCLHEMKQTRQAKELLLKAPASFRESANYLYNLACYEAQLGDISAARTALKKCFTKDNRFRADALEDLDLEPLWRSMGKF